MNSGVNCEHDKKRMTVKEVSKLTGVSIRTLQYYDKIGLLKPAGHTESGYRMYDDTSLKQLQQILLFRELEFPLKEIKEIMASPNYDKNKALEQQIKLLELKREHIDNLITFARGLKLVGGNYMEFKAFDTKKIDEYAKQVKEQWGKTDAYKEFEKKSANRTNDEELDLGQQLMAILAEFGVLKVGTDGNPAAPEALAQAKKVQDFITANYYNCTKEIFAGLGQMYGAGGDFTANINAVGGEGAAEFAAEVIATYCK